MGFINAIALAGNADAGYRIHYVRDGEVRSMPLVELDRRAASVAWRLHGLELRAGDRIGIMAGNCIEWVIADLAVLKLGAVTAGFEAGRFEVGAAIRQHGLKLLFADAEVLGTDPRAMDLAVVGRWAVEGHERAGPLHGGYAPDDVCAIKFTSGSTRQPKGLEATVGSVDDTLAAVQDMFRHGDGDTLLVFLRLALLQQRYWIYSALVHGHDVAVTAMDHVLPMARAVSPTVVMGVPGFYDEVKALIEAAGGCGPLDLAGRKRAIQDLLGGRIRYLWTGSAPASAATLDFYNGCGVPLYEGYGLNETCIVAKNGPGAHRVGSVGRVLPNKTVRFDGDGVLIVASRHPVNTRYTWCAPGDNERMFLPSGEVRTQDLGYMDEDGFLYILGRVDDVITLSSGRNVLVRLIEEHLKLHPDVHECILYGTGRPFLTALVSLSPGVADGSGVEAHIRAMNETLPPEQQVRGLVIADERFSIENDLLTSQFKPKRKQIHGRFSREIEAVYGM
ncbi:AMP-binding protein [Arenibaculum sp.]|uniref:AMP-binding protein n=1 Tax=Arenibaculum sp. TaxID=2865862 RepID=UPI002E1410EE|nr:AMP-binding protein [Arenibaculum sp.]